MNEKILQWAEDREIFRKSNPSVHFLKILEETGELAKAIGQKDSIKTKDGIGDIYIALVIIGKLMNVKIELDWYEVNPSKEEHLNNLDALIATLLEKLSLLSWAIAKKNIPHESDIVFTIEALANLAEYSNFTLKGCIEFAYKDIQNRKGSIVNGLFVKDN